VVPVVTTLKMANTICAKLRQLPPSATNVLAIVTPGPVPEVGDVAGAVHLLKARAERKDETYFSRKGFDGARDFRQRYVRLSGVLVLGSSDAPIGDSERGSAPLRGTLWVN